MVTAPRGIKPIIDFRVGIRMSPRLALPLLLGATIAYGQVNVQTRGAFFALSVPDAHASAQWYKDLLGLRVTLETPERDNVSVIVLEGDGLIVELIEHSEAAGRPADSIRVHGIAKAGIIVDDFDALMLKVRERKITTVAGPFPKRDGQRANVIVRDNAGNMIQFFGK